MCLVNTIDAIIDYYSILCTSVHFPTGYVRMHTDFPPALKTCHRHIFYLCFAEAGLFKSILLLRHKKEPQPNGWGFFMAEKEGFEPSIPFWGIHDFQSCALGQLRDFSISQLSEPART